MGFKKKGFHMKSIKCMLVVSALIAAGSLVACNQSSRSSDGDPTVSRVGLTLDASTHTLLIGEVVTIIARTEDTYGRDSKLTWTSTSGKLTTEQDGRVARVKFDEAGLYTVTAVLSVEGRETRRATVDIRVKPIQ